MKKVSSRATCPMRIELQYGLPVRGEGGSGEGVGVAEWGEGVGVAERGDGLEAERDTCGDRVIVVSSMMAADWPVGDSNSLP